MGKLVFSSFCHVFNENNNNKAPHGLSLVGWLVGRAPDTYKMSHKARAIYSL